MSIGSARTPCKRGDAAALRTIPRAPHKTHLRPGNANTESRAASSIALAACDVSSNSRLSSVHTKPPALGDLKVSDNQAVTASRKPASSNPAEVFGSLPAPPPKPATDALPDWNSGVSSHFRTLSMSGRSRLASRIRPSFSMNSRATAKYTDRWKASIVARSSIWKA
jgi:hypothetical protein